MVKRMKCIGGCGREVLPKLGAECRKCRRRRVHAGQKRMLRVKRGTAPGGGERKKHLSQVERSASQ